MAIKIKPEKLTHFFGVPEPKVEGKKLGWWKPECSVCNKKLKSEFKDDWCYWRFSCECWRA